MKKLLSFSQQGKVSLLLLLSATLVLLRPAAALTTISGSSLQWTLSNDTTSVPGSVPGGVYSDLQAARVLDQGDVYYRYNDLDYRWVSYTNWTYSATFQVSEKLKAEKKIILEFEGVDTVASITANGVLVGETNNMFVKYIFDVTSIVQSSSEVTLEIAFVSPVEWSRRAYEEQAANYPVLPECQAPESKGECHANHIRKMQASFSWDWGPAFPSMGVWRPFTIIGFSSTYIRDMTVITRPFEPLPPLPDPDFRTSWELEVYLDIILADPSLELRGQVDIFVDGVRTTSAGVNFGPSSTGDLINMTITTYLGEDSQLWWPVGYGNQTLYQLQVECWNVDNSEIAIRTARIGLRTAFIDQQFADLSAPEAGRLFRPYINNVPIFMRGSNWIPAHVLPERVTPSYVRQLLEDAVAANQNAVRVWGGGLYETEEFYDVSTAHGLLPILWQDMMFACSMYPTSDWFLQTVTEEVNSQAKRLNLHPSVLFYNANNENEGALRDNWYGTNVDFEQYKSDYIELYVNTIMPLLSSIDPSREVQSSSPSNGIQTILEGYVSENPGDPRYGDIHYYNYASNGWNPKTYPNARFASEYGFQSWPSFKTLSQQTSSEDWTIGSDMLEHRQHHPNGQVELAAQISMHMTMPEASGGQAAFERYLYLSQVHQAMAIRTESEAYRRMMTTLDGQGMGSTSGALYWQLNDIWAGASWASIEFGGRWKMLHYYSKNFFSPMMVSPFIENNTVHVSFVNDLPQATSNVNLRVQLIPYDISANSLSVTVFDLSFNALEASVVASFDLTTDLNWESICSDAVYSKEDSCYLTFEVFNQDGSLRVPETFLLLGEPKNAKLSPAQIRIVDVMGPSADGVYEIELSCDQVALFVFVETDVAGVFSDNGFIMHGAGRVQYRSIQFWAREETTAEFLLGNIQVTSYAT
ncbi:beta-mannosidase [Hyalella azteca]|uniref:beta-mannosidase n=1 Tax=Hyalella azteca TaxID=294128 RepID=A0A8B7PA35_HYAAZ|nr:beta-mannosidase [Hyalella azteca]